jgi:putative membrane protein
MKTCLPQLISLLAIPVLTLSLNSVARADVSSADKSFVQKAAVAGMFEVQSGQVASTKATAQNVKDFGAEMVTDHGKANDELKSIASSKNIDVPTALDAKHQKMLDALNAASGTDFDTLYLKDMKKGHAAADALFTKEGNSGTDPDLKAFASKTDVTIKHHIDMLNDIDSKMK